MGRTLCQRGDPIRHPHLILQGTLEIAILPPDGRRSVCWYIGPEQWFGLIAAIDSKGSVHTVRAHSAARLFSIPKGPFLAAMRTDPGLATFASPSYANAPEPSTSTWRPRPATPAGARRPPAAHADGRTRPRRPGRRRDRAQAHPGRHGRHAGREPPEPQQGDPAPEGPGAIAGTGGRIALRDVPTLERMSVS